ncbi:MAG TPA: magnesium transporter [Thermodesulfobacteriota bacterium]
MTESTSHAPPDVDRLLDARDLETLKGVLAAMPQSDVASLLAERSEADQVILFRLLDKDRAIEVFEQLDVDQQRRLLEGFTEERAREVIASLDPDDRARLLDELPAKVAKRLLQALPPAAREATATLLGYPEQTAGRIMTPEYVDLRATMTAGEALARIRAIGLDRETIYTCFVVDATRHLLGTVSLKDLVLAPPGALVAGLMTPNPVSARTEDDQEEVARLLSRHDLLAVPILDREGRLVGIVTVDDVVDVLEAEATEDIYRMGAVETGDASYFRAGIGSAVRQRIGWLLLLLATNTLTSQIISSQADLLTVSVVLAAFIPLLTASGGNVGAQSSTVVIRGLAVQELSWKRAPATLLREGAVGLLIGLALGALAFGWAAWLSGSLAVAAVVGGTLVVVTTLASLTGTLLPLVFARLGLDPALMSTPFITTVVDVVGVLLYFAMARVVLERLH